MQLTPILDDTPQPAIQSHEQIRPQLLKQGGLIRELFSWGLLLVTVYTLINLVSARYVVDGGSMFPNFDTGQFVLISRINYILGDPQRGDVAVLHYPRNVEVDYIKRIIGVPGDTVEIRNTRVYVNGVELDESYIHEPCDPNNCMDAFWQLGDNDFFVMGDNRNRSSDSRAFGVVKRENVIGKAVFRYWPLSDVGIVDRIGMP